MTDPIQLPLGFSEWLPVSQAGLLALLTFVQEDIPTVSAALLASAGNLTWLAGFLGCFLGIWLGDALLYALARTVGKPLLGCSMGRRFLDPAAVARSEQWFAERGTWLLMSSRFVPGTRLPTYLAAGFLRLPFSRFLAVTGTAVGIWTLLIFGLARLLGVRLLGWLQQWGSTGVAFLLGALTLFLTAKLVPRLLASGSLQRFKVLVLKWYHWEFWPSWLFYGPVAIYYGWLGLRYRGMTLPTSANPGIAGGGFVGESKISILRELSDTSPQFTAKAYLIPAGSTSMRLAFLNRIRTDEGLEYPFILKPDVGQRGTGVKLIRYYEQYAAYLQQTSAPLIAQRYAPGPHEMGVFYYRFPGESRGHIFAITEKVFPTITGDGERTIEELIRLDERARLIAGKYLARLDARRNEILAPGQSLKLVEAGNHAQGCIFRDGWRFYSEQLEQRIDEISRRLNGFFVGRYDIRYASEPEIRQGERFQIVELNGATSEATSIYDARNSLFSAYRTLFRQWDLVFAIGAENRAKGMRSMELTGLYRQWRESSLQALSYPLSD